MPVHFWVNGKRQDIIDVCNVGDCVDMYEDETQSSSITVYFEAGAGAHEVAQFDSEETYMACLPALEQLAMLKGYIVTESVGKHDPLPLAHLHVLLCSTGRAPS
jgi:hypothetical protein